MTGVGINNARHTPTGKYFLCVYAVLISNQVLVIL